MTQPTTGYTSDEINAVVQQLVLSSITTPIDTLGVRRSDLTFNQFQQTAAGLFVLYPNAPFYVLWLGVQRIRDQVTAEAVIIQQLLAAIAATGMKVTPVSDVSPLFNAQAALQNLAAAAANRTSAIGKVSNAPAYQQFAANVSSFLSGPGQNVKSNGQIVQTPQQAKAAIPGLMKQLQAAHTALVASITLIVNGVTNYNSISLPAIVSESVLSSAASLIGSSATLLNSLSPTDRLTEVRQVVLNLIASKTAVDTFGTLNQPSDYYTLAGVGMPYSDAQHLATPAVAVGDQTGAMAIITGLFDLLLLVLEGETTVPITLPPSVIAELDGQGSDLNFFVGDGSVTGIPQNNTFKMKINTTAYVCPLTLSPYTTGPFAVTARTADQVAADINAVIPTGQVQAQGYYSPLKYSGKLITDGAGTTWTVPSYGSPPAYIANLFTLNVSPGDTIECAGSFYIIATVDPGGAFVTTTTAGPISSTVAVQIGPVNRKLKIICVNPNEQITAGTSITVYADDVASTGCLQMLGLTSGMTMSCSPTTPDVVASYINANTSLVEAGTYISSLYVGSAQGSTTSSTTLVITEAEASGSQMFVGPGTDLTYTVTGLVTGGMISTGDTMAVRSGPTPASYYVISEINGQSDVTGHTLAVGDVVLGVLGAGSPVGAGSATNVSVQFGPTLTLSKYDCITVQGPNINQGLYLVASQGGTGFTPLDVSLQSALSSPAAGSLPSTFTISHGKRSLTLASLNTTTASKVFVGGNAAPLFFSEAATLHGIVQGTSSFLGTTLTWTVTVIVDAGNISVGYTLDTQNTSSGSSACYIVQSINGDPMATNHALTMGDVIVASGTIGGPLDNVAAFFPSVTQLGTTPWFQLPAIPNGLNSGDIMEVYATQYNSPTVSYDIEQVIAGINVIEISPDIVDGTTWTFTPQPVPFARLRVGIVNDYTLVQGLMQSWLNGTTQQPLYFTNMNAVINPLLTSDNPTVAQVGAATAAVNELWSFLQGAQATAMNLPPSQAIDTTLADYDVEPVTVIDTLITSYTNQGSDRAVDILLSGDFVTFFGLTMDGASYSGAMQEATRAVAMQDLPVSKVNRPEQQNGVIQSTSVSADPEYPANLANETLGGAQPEVPGTYGQPTSYLNNQGS
jgi:hypothetical protein